jgi:methylated-DNA-[protein]-cysteine S-methyltransferase
VKLAQLTSDATHPILVKAERQLNDYFAGTRTQFDIPLDFRELNSRSGFGASF